MSNNVHIEGLGLVAFKKRNIKPGTQFNSLFPLPQGENKLINNTASVFDTLDFIATVVKGTLKDTEKLAQLVKGTSLEQTLANIHNFFYNHYQYKLDTPGIEQVRRPSRAWADRAKGIDCDCFSTSISSVLSNLQIPHYLKIVGINGRNYYQHVYVIVPKTPNADVNVRSNYWVLDPVIDIEYNQKSSFDKEAKNITKKHVKKMIPLEYLNGLETDKLGNEFEGLEEEISGLGSDDELGIAMAFRNRLRRHVQNTIRKVEQNPTVVENVVQPQVFLKNLRRLNDSFRTNNEAKIVNTLEELSGEEEQMLQDQFRGYGSAINTSDDYLYNQMFGELDDNMLSAVDGLGRKGRSKQRQNNANKGKKGFFTKTKNAFKKSKEISKKFGKNAGKVLKKIGRQVVKNNPISLAARSGFLIAMRTNLGTIAERIYWGMQTKDFALSKGIGLQYYNLCQTLWAMTRKTFVNVLKGDESALRKAILNGRAAKKIAVQLKRRGMTGVEEVSGISGIYGLGTPVAAASVSSAASFLAPLIAFIKRNFKNIASVVKTGVKFIAKRRNKKQEAKSPNEAEEMVDNENGSQSEAPSNNIRSAASESFEQAKNPDATINENDGSVETASSENDKEPNQGQESGRTANKTNLELENTGEEPKKSNTGIIVAGLGLAALAALAISKSGNKKSVNGLGATEPCSTASKVLKKSNNKFLKSKASKKLNSCKVKKAIV